MYLLYDFQDIFYMKSESVQDYLLLLQILVDLRQLEINNISLDYVKPCFRLVHAYVQLVQ